MKVITEEYKKQLEKIAKYSLENRVKAITGLYNRDLTIEEKNRALRDIYYLLSNKWELDENWKFTDIHHLDSNNHTSETNIEKDWKELLEKIEKAKKQTPHNYLELTEKNPDTIKDVQDYINWFYFYLPYLVTNIDSTTDWSTATERLKWFISKAPAATPIEMLKTQAMEYLVNWYSENNN